MSGAWRILVPGLLFGAAVGALVRSANASAFGRFGGILAATALGLVGVGVIRDGRWAYGAAFFLGVFWLWAVLGLTVQGVIGLPEFLAWFVWSVVVMVGSVQGRRT